MNLTRLQETRFLKTALIFMGGYWISVVAFWLHLDRRNPSADSGFNLNIMAVIQLTALVSIILSLCLAVSRFRRNGGGGIILLIHAAICALSFLYFGFSWAIQICGLQNSVC